MRHSGLRPAFSVGDVRSFLSGVDLSQPEVAAQLALGLAHDAWFFSDGGARYLALALWDAASRSEMVFAPRWVQAHTSGLIPWDAGRLGSPFIPEGATPWAAAFWQAPALLLRLDEDAWRGPWWHDDPSVEAAAGARVSQIREYFMRWAWSPRLPELFPAAEEGVRGNWSRARVLTAIRQGVRAPASALSAHPHPNFDAYLRESLSGESRRSYEELRGPVESVALKGAWCWLRTCSLAQSP